LLAKTGARGEAWHAYEMAIGLEKDDSVRRFLQGRRAKLGAG
jgi:RNA polymerase sigma-70 factor, ECF subfamily